VVDFSQLLSAGAAPLQQAGGVPFSTLATQALPQFPSALPLAQGMLNLSPQEVALYQMHLKNLTGPGGVDNADGSRSTLFQSVQEHNGKFYNVPTVWNGKIETEKYTDPNGKVWDVPNKTALQNVEKMGWDKFPSYSTPDEADARYDAMHKFMEQDTEQYLGDRRK
jgi:hypothetical protein